MNYTYFYIKLLDKHLKEDEYIFKIKLTSPIRDAKSVEFSALVHPSWYTNHDSILLIESNLIDKNYIYTNVRDSGDFDESEVFNNQFIFIGCGNETNSVDLYKIDETKGRLINDFYIKVKRIKKKKFNKVSTTQNIIASLIKIKIYHV